MGARSRRRVACISDRTVTFEAHLNRIADELVEGRGGLAVTDSDGLLESMFKGLSNLRWTQKLALYSFLWSAGNRWTLKRDLPALKLVEEMMALRNRLIHSRPEKEELEGDPVSAGIHVHNRREVGFGSGPGPDLPDELLGRLALPKLHGYVNAVEEIIRRLHSLGNLWPPGTEEPTSRAGFQALDEDGSRPWIDYEGRIGYQVRWCKITRRYVMHTFTAPVPAPSPLVADENSRACRAAGRCPKVAECPWPAIKGPAQIAAGLGEGSE